MFLLSFICISSTYHYTVPNTSKKQFLKNSTETNLVAEGSNVAVGTLLLQLLLLREIYRDIN